MRYLTRMTLTVKFEIAMSKYVSWSAALIGFFLFSCKSDDRRITPDMLHFPDSSDAEEAASILFESDSLNFGVLSVGEKRVFKYRFVNEGKSPLILSQVSASCGCTVPKEWPAAPLGPGEGGEITVEFDSRNNSGAVHKKIYVVSNGIPRMKTLVLAGNVMGVESISADPPIMMGRE
jgi:hypothetical protein